MLTLYLAPGSSSMAPHIALHEIGVPFDVRPLSFARREQRAADYLALNPEGKVPMLLIDGRALTEVAGILFYLGRRFPEAGLLPDDVEAQARIVACMSFLAATVHPASQRGGEAAHTAYAHAERRLEGRKWIVGEHMSIADIHLFRLFWRNRPRVPLMPDVYPALTAHYERMIARPAVQRTCAAEAAIGYELPG